MHLSEGEIAIRVTRCLILILTHLPCTGAFAAQQMELAHHTKTAIRQKLEPLGRHPIRQLLEKELRFIDGTLGKTSRADTGQAADLVVTNPNARYELTVGQAPLRRLQMLSIEKRSLHPGSLTSKETTHTIALPKDLFLQQVHVIERGSTFETVATTLYSPRTMQLFRVSSPGERQLTTLANDLENKTADLTIRDEHQRQLDAIVSGAGLRPQPAETLDYSSLGSLLGTSRW